MMHSYLIFTALVLGTVSSFKAQKKPFQVTSALNALGQEQIEVYSSLGCKFCRISKAKLRELGLIDFTSIIVDDPPGDLVNKRRLDMARASTVPQIYVGPYHIGGCDALLAEVESGVFFERLEKMGIKTREVPSEREEVQEPPSLLDLRFKNKNGQWILNGSSRSMVESMEALSIAQALQQQALLLTDLFASADGTRVSYKSMASSEEFLQYIHLSSRLQDVSLSSLQDLPSSVRFSLFSNVYNGMIVHANCVLGCPDDTPAARQHFFSGESGAAYDIAGLRFTPDDIEHGILRANTRHPYATPEGRNSFWSAGDPRTSLSVDNLDPRVHFVLNCGAASCPPIKVLGEDPEPALASATAAYLSGDNLRITTKVGISGERKTVVTLPKLLFWYSCDFGENDEAVIHTLIRLLGEHSESAAQLQSALTRGDVAIEYLDYDWTANSA